MAEELENLSREDLRAAIFKFKDTYDKTRKYSV